MKTATKYERPPRGITPRFIHDEKRLQEINDAVIRYRMAKMPIPEAWVEEKNEIMKRLEDRWKQKGL